MADKFSSPRWVYIEKDPLHPTGEHIQASLTLDVVRDKHGIVREATVLLEGRTLDSGAVAEHLGGLTLDRLEVVEALSDTSSRISVVSEDKPEVGVQLSFGDLLDEQAQLARALNQVSPVSVVVPSQLSVVHEPSAVAPTGGPQASVA